jgi:hypothetical protein
MTELDELMSRLDNLTPADLDRLIAQQRDYQERFLNGEKPKKAEGPKLTATLSQLGLAKAPAPIGKRRPA